MNQGKIIIFYKYVDISNPHEIAAWQKELCVKLGLTGRILIAHEGINATLGGSDESTLAYSNELLKHPLFGGIDIKTSPGSSQDFPRLLIKVKNEVVRLGKHPSEVGPADSKTHISPEQAHAMIMEEKDLVLLDARNNYESRIGKFINAITPDIENFRDFPEYIDKIAETIKDKKVLMYCTAGIRCERALSYVKAAGIKDVYQISGGIHRYVEKFPDGFFRGKNYVFDERIAVTVNNDILTNCDICEISCDLYANCMNAECNKHYISCDNCLLKLNNCCSEKCHVLVSEGKVRIRPKRMARYTNLSGNSRI